MNRWILVPSVVLGLLLVVAHLAICYKKTAPPNFQVILNLLLGSAGIVFGFALIMVPLFPQVKQMVLAEADFYLFLSGVLVFLTSVHSAYRELSH